MAMVAEETAALGKSLAFEAALTAREVDADVAVVTEKIEVILVLVDVIETVVRASLEFCPEPSRASASLDRIH